MKMFSLMFFLNGLVFSPAKWGYHGIEHGMMLEPNKKPKFKP
jgi:hypothetical protein